MGIFFARSRRRRLRFFAGGLAAICAVQLGSYLHPAFSPTTAKAVLVQPNLLVGRGYDNQWSGVAWDRHSQELLRLSELTCTSLPARHARAPSAHGPARLPPARSRSPPSSLGQSRHRPSTRATHATQALMQQQLTTATGATVVLGNASADPDGHDYNSATIYAPSGTRVGRYDKIHLVTPFGEYVPLRRPPRLRRAPHTKRWRVLPRHRAQGLSSRLAPRRRTASLRRLHLLRSSLCL